MQKMVLDELYIRRGGPIDDFFSWLPPEAFLHDGEKNRPIPGGYGLYSDLELFFYGF